MIRCIAIDDDPLFLKMLEVLFQEIKSAELIATFTNPVEGIMSSVKQKPEVLLMDLEMPYLHGFEALDTLEKPPKVIVISGHLNQPLDSPIPIAEYINKADLKTPQKLEEAINSVLKK